MMGQARVSRRLPRKRFPSLSEPLLLNHAGRHTIHWVEIIQTGVAEQRQTYHDSFRSSQFTTKASYLTSYSELRVEDVGLIAWSVGDASVIGILRAVRQGIALI